MFTKFWTEIRLRRKLSPPIMTLVYWRLAMEVEDPGQDVERSRQPAKQASKTKT